MNIDKNKLEEILKKLWKEDDGFASIERIFYNKALQDIQCEMDALEVQEEPASEDKMTISKEWFEHCKKSWYNEGYIDGEYNRDRQFEEPVSDDLGEFINELSKQFPEVSFAKVCKIAARTAKWQKQQMMKDTIEGNVLANGMGEPILHLWDKGKHLVNKKVKVVVIEEDWM